jgi:sugar phosphate isomerase/epimerase
MIYISSSCAQFNKISQSIEFLAENGFTNIDISGGTDYYHGLTDDLKKLKLKYNLNYLVHNYFPPPKKHFVLNLASLNDDIYSKSMDHYISAIDLAKEIGAKKYGIHAGFFIDPELDQLGNPISYQKVADKEKAIERFCDGFNLLKEQANSIDLYIENNVISASNFKTYGENILMLTKREEFVHLSQRIKFRLLVDIAHLKVSCKTLGLNFADELGFLSGKSDYIHLSDNDGSSDSNHPILQNSEMYNLLKLLYQKNKTYSLEIYKGIEEVTKTFNLINKIK